MRRSPQNKYPEQEEAVIPFGSDFRHGSKPTKPQGLNPKAWPLSLLISTSRCWEYVSSPALDLFLGSILYAFIDFSIS